jgi:hypothetical protein
MISIGKGGFLGRSALVGLGTILAACTANPPTAPTYPAAYTYPPPRPLGRPHDRAVARPKRPAATAVPGEEPAKETIHEPVASLAAPAAATFGPPSAGWGDPQEPLPGPAATELVGLDQQRASELLGPATTTESRAPATVWHYKSSRCELDLVFYMEMRSGQMRTLHYDFKSGAETPQ